MGQHQSGLLKSHSLITSRHSADCYLNKRCQSDTTAFLDHIRSIILQHGANDVISHVASIQVTATGSISRQHKYQEIFPGGINLMKYQRKGSTKKKNKDVGRILTQTFRRNNKEYVFIYLPCHCNGRYVWIDINECDAQGRLPLNLCIRQKALDLIRLLIQCGANVNACDMYGRTPLHVVCETGDVEITRLLLTSNAEVNKVDKPSFSSMISMDLTPLSVATMHQNTQCINVLLNAGADPNIAEGNSLNTPLHKCCIYGYTTCTQVLLNHCAFGNLRNADGVTPLQLALIHNNMDVVRKLTSYGCDVTNYNKSLPSILSLAAMRGQLDIVKQCLIAGENVNRADNFNYTALYYTVTLDTYALWMHDYFRINKIEFNAHCQITNRKEIVELLINHGANVQNVLQQTQRDSILTKKHFTLSQNVAVLLKCIQAIGFSAFTSLQLYRLFTLVLHERGTTVAKLLLAANPRLNTHISYEFRDVVDWQGMHSKEAELNYLQTVCGAGSQTATWVHERVSQPRPLQEWCRDVVRQCLATNVVYNVHELSLPRKLRDYICLKDMVIS